MALLDELEKMNSSELEALKQRTLKQQEAQTIGTAAASLAPGLIGLLTGGTDEFRARQFERGNQIAESAGKQYMDNQKNLKEVVLDGQPRYVTGQEALYEQPYKAPVKGGLSDEGKIIKGLYQSRQAYDKKTGEYGTEIFNTATGERQFIPETISGATAPKVTTLPTLQGGKEVSPVNPYLTTPPPVVKKVHGIGDVAQGNVPSGTVSKQEAEQFIKDSAKAKDKKVKIVEAKKNAQQSIKLLSDPTSTPEELAAGVQLMLKAVNKERLSDPDAIRLQGDELKSYKRLLEDFVAGRGLGEMNPKTRQGFINVARSFIGSADKEMKSIDELYTPKGRLPDKGQDRLNKTSKGAVNSEDDWKKRQEALKGIK